MKTTLALTLLVALAAAVPGSAEKSNAESSFNLSVAQVLSDARAAAPARSAANVPPERALDSTLTALQDGPQVAGLVSQALRLIAGRVDFRAQDATSAYACPSRWVDEHEGCPTTIYIKESLPRYPRILAPLIAREAARSLMSGVADIVDSAEKRYMMRSIEVRTWLELGGDRSALPVIEPLIGYRDEALAKEFRLWLDNGPETALALVGEETKAKPLAVIIAQTQSEIDALAPGDPRRTMLAFTLENARQAEKTFSEFLRDERSWKLINR